MDSAEYVIKNSTSEEIVIDNNGINCKSMNDIGYYGDHQCRLTGNGLYLTDKAWKSVKSAIGLIKFNNEWKYGVIADCIIGDFIVGKHVNVSNEKGNVEITGDGIKITNGYIDIANENKRVLIDPHNETKTGYIFKITGNNGDTAIEMDSEGNAKFQRTIYATNGEFSGTIQSSNGKIGGWIIDQSSLYKEGATFNGVRTKVELSSINGIRSSGYSGSVQLGSLLNPNEIRFTDSDSNYSRLLQGTKNNNIPALCCYDSNFFSDTIYSNTINTSTINASSIVLSNGKEITAGTVTITTQEPVIYNDGSTFINGNLYVGGTGVIKQSFDDSHRIAIDWINDSNLAAYVDGIYIGLFEYQGHNLNSHDFDTTDSGNFVTGTVDNIASVSWVQGKVSSSDERVKTDFQSLPSTIDNIFDSLKPQQYRFNNILEKDGYYFGDTAQHIEKIFSDYGLDIEDYNIVQKRNVNEFNGESNYIDSKHDKYHYINQDNIIGLCVDQIQKLKNRIKELEG